MSNTHFSGPISLGNGIYESVVAAKTLDSEDNGKTFGLNLAGGFTITLPALSTISKGWTAKFRCETAPTTAYILSTPTADLDKIIGFFVTATGHTTAGDIETAGDTIEFVASTALPGDYVVLENNGTNWFAYGACSVPAALTISG